MPKMLRKIVATAAGEANSPDWCEEVLAGSFRAFGRQFGPVVTISLSNRIASANDADEIDELSGFDLFVSKLQSLHSAYFVFDISKVTQIDHAALRHFLGAKSVLESDGSRMVLTGSPSSNDTLLSLLLTLLPHFSNSEEALRYLQSHEYPSANPDTAGRSLEGCMIAQRIKTRDGIGPVADSSRSGDADVNAQRFSNTVEAEVIGDEIFQYYSLAGC